MEPNPAETTSQSSPRRHRTTRSYSRWDAGSIAFGTTTDSLIASIEDAARRKKVPVKSISDFTAERVEIELVLAAGAKPDLAIKALYAFTSCEVATCRKLKVSYLYMAADTDEDAIPEEPSEAPADEGAETKKEE